ncbi:MAG: carboxyl transferase domain-containing protein, partial [Acidobacteriota bacterium]
MAKMILHRIGDPLDSFMDRTVHENNLKYMKTLNSKYDSILNEIRSGWGDKYIERVHKKNKMTAWERIDLLKDKGSEIFPIGSFVNYGKKFGDTGSEKLSPGAGVITVFTKVEGRYITIIANDNTVASGSWWPRTPEKIQRAQEISLRLRIPVVYLIDSSGLFLPEQSNTFPGRYGAGHIFKMNSRLSDAQVPQIAGVFGDCIAGGGYMPIISDIVYMTEQAYMVIAGAALIKGAKSQNITSLTIGGPDVHVHLSGCADFRVPDDATLLKKIKEEIKKLPTSGIDYYRYGGGVSEPAYPTEEIEGIFPENYRVNYDMRQVIARLTDSSLFREIFPGKGEEIICGIGKINGLYCGIVANNTELIGHRRSASEKRPGGILYKEGISKITSFIRACDDDGIPIIWLQDISGFDIGPEAEKNGLLGYGSNLLYAISNLSVPVFTILLRKASGAGYYAMNGLPYEPVLQISTPITRLSVMEGKTLAIGAYNTKLDDNFNIISENKEEYAA